MKNAKSSRIANPPETLSPEAKGWWNRLVFEYQLDDAPARFLLESALRAFDRMNEAAAAVDEHGIVVVDKFGQLKTNPATTVERDSRAAMLSALKQLNLDVIPPHATPGRPTR